MADWQPIDTAPRETGRPLLLYPYPYPRTGKKTEARHPSYRVLFDVNDPTVRQMIKLAKRRGYVTYDALSELMPPEVFSPEQIKDVLDQFAKAGINVVGAKEARTLEEVGFLMREMMKAAEREQTTGDQPKAPVTQAHIPEDPPVIYSNVFEGYWDDTRWRSAGGVPCEPTHWMPLPSPPLTLVGQ